MNNDVTIEDSGYCYKLIRSAGLYDVKLVWDPEEGGEELGMIAAFNKNGNHIGDEPVAVRLCDKMGISPELGDTEDSVCTIGKSSKDGKWYGWSHRAIAGFRIGDKIYDEGFDDDKAKPQDHGFVDIKNEDDARLAAIRYAECVS